MRKKLSIVSLLSLVGLLLGVTLSIKPVSAACSPLPYCGRNGVPVTSQCAQGKVLVDQGYPTGQWNDANMRVKTYYSPTCETMWAVLTNVKAAGRVCHFNLVHFGNYSWGYGDHLCPAAGTSLTTPMVDDHSPTYGLAAYVVVNDRSSLGDGQYLFRY